jgi:adenylate cyclase
VPAVAAARPMKKDHFRSLSLSLLVTLLAMALYLFAIRDIEGGFADHLFDWRGGRAVSSPIVIVSVDEESIRALGRWPWPRNRHAQLIDRLTQAGAKSITFDVLFTEPDKDRPWADDALGRAASKSGRVVFGMLFQYDEEGNPKDPLLPIDTLARPGTDIGSVNIFPENDGVTRKIPLGTTYNEHFVPTLSLAALAKAEGKAPEVLFKELSLPARGVWNEILLNYVGGYQSFPYHSFSDVIAGKVPAEAFRDKIVFVGGTAVGLFDFKAIPNVPTFPGLEIHANAVENYLNRTFLRQTGAGWGVLILLIFGLGSGLLAIRSPMMAGIVSASLLFAYWILCHTLFRTQFLLLPFRWPALCLLLSYTVVLLYRFITERKEKRWIRDTFAQYMSPKLVEVLAKDPGRVKLGGEDRQMTVFFSDLAGFTSISEHIPPSELVHLLNEYLDEMTDIITLKYDGYVDKFIGDAIMAFWNGMVDQKDHAKLACFAALDQVVSLKELQKRLAERNLPLLDFRAGINSGHMVVGNMGSKRKFNYTVMGDAVNLGSRLEGANKPFHTRLMISEFTYALVKDEVEVRPLDLLRVPGKKIPIPVYELAARRGELSPEQKAAFAAYAEGLALYRERKFERAGDVFKKALASLPQDGPSRLYIDRCRDFLASPPPADWDGVFDVKTK